VKDVLLREGEENNFFLGSSQASPAHASDKNRVKKKTEWLEAEGLEAGAAGF
jgi:hypothetical protein